MKGELIMAKLGLQLYTVRDETEKDFFGTIRKIGKMGYDGVEFAGGLMKTASAEEVKKVLDETGLEVAGACFGLEEVEDRMKEIINYCKKINCPAVVYPGIPEGLKSVDGYKKIADRFNKVGKILKESGLKFLYHVHGHEFEVLNGKTGMEFLIENINREYVMLETDVYWVEWAGVDSIEFLKKYACISPYLHLKDMKDKVGKHDTEVGEGALDIAGVMREGKKNNSEWFIVEQEEFDMLSIESVVISLKNIKNLDLTIN